MTKQQNALLQELVEMHTYCRPMGSPTELEFVQKYVASLPGAFEDQWGNWHVAVGESKILWSAHTDTVHHEGGRQRLHYDAAGFLMLSRKAKSRCLGADDTAGCFILRQMILRGVPGYYVFHWGEEKGGRGSSDLARCRKFLAEFNFAIAFDRRGTQDIITEQMGGYCASDAFAENLASQLEKASGGWLSYKGSDEGIFTDTANYTDDIPECTNLSVGYQHEHTPQEYLDCFYVLALLDAICQIQESELVIDRRPGEVMNPNSPWTGLRGYDWPGEWDEQEEMRFGNGLYLDSAFEAAQRQLKLAMGTRK
jgi:hypothetical protein